MTTPVTRRSDEDSLGKRPTTRVRRLICELSISAHAGRSCALADGAAKELKPGDVAEYVVVRVCDEITVDLMAKACGRDYESSQNMVTPVIIDGVSIPFASPTLLWKTKQTYREKDEIDCSFLRKLLENPSEWPVE